MTFDEQGAASASLLGKFGTDANQDALKRHAKHATIDFARDTSVTTVRTVLDLSSATNPLYTVSGDTLTIHGKRVGRIWKAEHYVNSEYHIVGVTSINDFDGLTSDTGSATRLQCVARETENIIRMDPSGVTTGVLRLYTSIVPVLQDRGSLTDNAESASGGTTTTVTFASIRGSKKVAGNATSSDYYNGCVLEFSTAGPTGQTSIVTDYNESAGSFTFFPAVTTAPTASTKFTIRDALEIHEDWTVPIVEFAAGMMGLLNRDTKALAEILLQRYQAKLKAASLLPYGRDPGAHVPVTFPEEEGVSYRYRR